MPGFNHYAKLKQIIASQPNGWFIKRINQPTTATNFKGETVAFTHYYRLYAADGSQIKYGKFQQLERLARALGVDALDLPVID